MFDLVVVGTAEDPHVFRVTKELKQRGARCEIMDLDAKVALRQSVEQGISISLNGEEIDERCLIWNRHRLGVGSAFYPTLFEKALADSDLEFCIDEWTGFYRLLITLYAEQTINNPRTTREMSKALQQLEANKVGLLTPPTLMTNSRCDALEFASVVKKVIVKASVARVRTTEPYPREMAVLTTAVSHEALQAAQDRQVAWCPHMFQMNIDKAYELRISVVGTSVFAYRIDSQAKEYTRTDWRVGASFTMFERTTIPEQIKASIFAFMKRYDLFHGHFDFAVDKEGRYWFLECNHDGAWAWLDDISDSEITRAFADAFEERLRTLRRNGHASAAESRVTA